MTVDEVRDALGVSEGWVYCLIRAGRLRTVDAGRRGRGSHTTVLTEDVERERLKRREMLEKRLSGL